MAQLDVTTAPLAAEAPAKSPSMLASLLAARAHHRQRVRDAQRCSARCKSSVAGELRFTDFQISLIQGLAASIPIAILAIPVGRMTDRGNRTRLLFGLSLLWTIGTIATVFAAGTSGRCSLARMLRLASARSVRSPSRSRWRPT